MATCIQKFRATDSGGGSLPFEVAFKFYLYGDYYGTLFIKSGQTTSVMFTQGKSYKIVPTTSVSGWVTPESFTFTACADQTIVYTKEVPIIPPVISSISWVPKGSFHNVATGASYTGRHGSEFKVVAVGPSSMPPLKVEEIMAELAGDTAQVYKRGSTFVLDGEGYTILHAIDDGECSQAVIARNTSTNQHPTIGEEVQFTASVVWNDDGATAATRQLEWFYLKPPSESYTKAYADDINNWTYFATDTLPAHVFADIGDVDVIYLKVIARNKSDLTAEFGFGRCSVGMFNLWHVADGFEITVVDATGADDLSIGYATLVPGTNAWIVDPNILRWDNVVNQVYFGARDKVGCAYSDPQPDMCGTYAMAVGSKYAIYRSTSFITVVPGESVFTLQSGRTSVTADRSYMNFLESSICGFFGISGSECTTFIAELWDPVFVANYVSILTTGKDTFGNERELTAFDHIALPFAVLGSLPVLNLLPFGALITNGLGATAKSGAKFGDEAIHFMLNFSMDAANKISTKDTWYFLETMGQITEAHATEIVNALTAGDTTLANTLLRKYAGESKGWWDYHKLNDLLRDALPPDVYGWLREQSGLPEIGAGTVINTAKQTTLSADDVAKLADAAKDSGVMDDVTAAVYKSLIDMPTASATKVEELANILKNSDEIATRVGAENVPMERFVDSTRMYHGMIKNLLGQTQANSWFKSNSKIATKAIDSAEPAKMADIPHSAQNVAGNQGTLVEDYCGGHVEPCFSSTSGTLFGSGKTAADEVVAATDEFVGEATSNWFTKGKAYTKTRYDKSWDWYNSLSEKGKERVVHSMVAASMFFAATLIYTIYQLTDADDVSPSYVLKTAKMEESYWVCNNAATAGLYDELAAALVIFRADVTVAEKWLEDNRAKLEGEETYEEFRRLVELRRIQIGIFETRLEELGPTGFIKCTSNVAFFYVELDTVPAGFSYSSKMVMLSGIPTGSHTIKIYREGYSPYCTKTVNIVDGGTEELDCYMTEIGECSEVTDVKIYIDPLYPVVDEKISFNGSGKSDDPIPSENWKWKFGEGSTATGQAVTHAYDSAKLYIVELLVENDCGKSKAAYRNVRVIEEVETGTIRCTSNQSGFEVYLDGNSVGSSYDTKLKVLSDVEVGSHTVKIEKGPGYTPESCTETVNVAEGRTETVHCEMVATAVESATLTIQEVVGTDGKPISGSWTVEIWVDGLYTKCKGAQTLTFGDGLKCDCSDPYNTSCEFGSHVIMLKKAGYKDLSISTSLAAGDAKTWYSPVMVPGATGETHDVNISVPEGSTVYVDGVPLESSSLGRLSMVLKSLRKE